MPMKVNMPDDFPQLTHLAERTDEIAETVLKAGGEVVLAKAKANLAGAIGHTKTPSRSTGQLLGALGLSPVKPADDGWDVRVGFAEPRKDGTANAKIASILEHGKHGQPAHPFMRPAKTGSKSAAVAAMKAAFEQEVGN